MPQFYQRYQRACWTISLLLGCLFILPNDCQASHLAGADLTYTCLGNNRYVLTLTVYRDCSGVDVNSLEFLAIDSRSCGINYTFPILRDSTAEVSQLCATQVGQSSCNGGLLPGYEIHLYRDTISFPATCSDWTITYESSARNAAITNLATGGASMHIQAGLDNSVCNNSPVFSTRPIPFYCAGQCHAYNHGTVDAENDSLLYALTCPRTFGGACIPPSAGTSPSSPLFVQLGTSFNFNPATGQMRFCPVAGQNQIVVVTVVVHQLSNGDTVGFVQRDIQMVIQDDPNCSRPAASGTPTVLSGGNFNAAEQRFAICSGETLLFSVVLHDPDADSIFLSSVNTNLDQVFGAANWNAFINTAPPFRIDSVELLVQINTHQRRIGGSNTFTIGISDQACPIPNEQIFSYQLSILGLQPLPDYPPLCPGITQQLSLNLNSYTLDSASFNWSQLSGPPVTFSNTTIGNPVLSIPNTTTDGDSIVLQVQFATTVSPSSSCSKTDTLVVYFRAQTLNISAFPTTLTLCPNNDNDTLNLGALINGPNLDLANGNYRWSAQPTIATSNLSDSTLQNPVAIVNQQQGDSIVYTLRYDYGQCTGTDQLVLGWRSNRPILSATPDTLCLGDTTQLLGLLSNTTIFTNPQACQYRVAPIAFNRRLGAGTPITTFLPNNNDGLSTPLPIGFDFEFFCNSYQQFVVSTNGFITFDATNTNTGCCSFAEQLPNNSPTSPNAIIALVWSDLVVTSSSTISYFITGTAPNRVLVIDFVNLAPALSSPIFPIPPTGGQIQLYEGSNIIELHVDVQQDPLSRCTQGIENADGTVGFASPGRNSSVWAAAQDAYRFTPTANSTTGPFTYNWSPNTFLTNSNQPNPQAFPNTTTTFYVTIDENGCTQEDSIEVVVTNTQPTLTCGPSTLTSVSFEWGGVPDAIAWEYSLDTGTTWVRVARADSSLPISGLASGTCVSLQVRAVLPTGAACTNPTIAQLECCTNPCTLPSTSTLTPISCGTSDDGVLTLVVNNGIHGVHPPYTGQLFDNTATPIGLPITTLDTLVFDSLSAGTYSVLLRDTLGCFAFSDPVVLDPADTLAIRIIRPNAVTCNNDSSGFALASIVTGNVVATTFAWSHGPTTASVNGLNAGTYVVTATAGNCQALDTFVVTNINLMAEAWVQQAGTRQITLAPDEQTTLGSTITTNAATTNPTWTVQNSTIATLDNNRILSPQLSALLEGSTWIYLQLQALPCVVFDSVQLTVNVPYLGLPDAFTPNADGVNDVFQPIGLDNSDRVVQFKVFNRWGQLVYDNAEEHAWDGTFQGVPQAQDGYLYIFEYRPLTGEPLFLRGSVTLLR